METELGKNISLKNIMEERAGEIQTILIATGLEFDRCIQKFKNREVDVDAKFKKLEEREADLNVKFKKQLEREKRFENHMEEEEEILNDRKKELDIWKEELDEFQQKLELRENELKKHQVQDLNGLKKQLEEKNNTIQALQQTAQNFTEEEDKYKAKISEQFKTIDDLMIENERLRARLITVLRQREQMS